MSDIVIVNADTCAIVDSLCGARFAACITDPPYSEHVHARATSNGTAGAGPHSRTLGFASLSLGLRCAVARIAASVTRWSAIFSDIEGAHEWRGAIAALDRAPEYVRAVPWVRWSQPQLSGDRPPSGCEIISLFHARGRKAWSGPGSLTCFDTRSLRGDKFSCEKPLDLMLSLVSYFCDAGETIVDPCAGSGTTGLAARLLARDAVLVEIDPDAAKLAHTRVHAPLTPRDRERCERWIAYQRAWLATEAPDTDAGRARYARAQADTLLLERAIG